MTGKAVVYASLGDELVQYDLDVPAAALTPKSSIKLPAQIQAAWAHPTQPFLYVASSNGGWMATPPRDEHFLTAFRMSSSGALTRVGQSVPLKYRPCFMCLDRDGSHILVDYNVPSDLTIHAIGSDGGIGAEIPHPPLGLRKYAHQVMVSPANDLVVVCARGNVATATTPEDPGALHPFTYENGEIRQVLPFTAPNGGAGFGARHLDFHPTKPFVYLTLEAQNELHVYRYDRNGFGAGPIHTSTTLFGQPSPAHQFSGTVRVHPSGRFVYATNRTLGYVEAGGEKTFDGGDNGIAVFGIKPDDGTLIPLQRISAEGVMPRTFGFDPSGELLIVANHFEVTARDGDRMRTVPQSIVMFRVGSDGRLTLAGKHEIAAGSDWVFWMDVVQVPA